MYLLKLKIILIFSIKVDKNKNNPIQKNIIIDNTTDYCIKTFIKTDLPDVYKIKEDSKLASC